MVVISQYNLTHRRCNEVRLDIRFISPGIVPYKRPFSFFICSFPRFFLGIPTMLGECQQVCFAAIQVTLLTFRCCNRHFSRPNRSDGEKKPRMHSYQESIVLHWSRDTKRQAHIAPLIRLYSQESSPICQCGQSIQGPGTLETLDPRQRHQLQPGGLGQNRERGQSWWDRGRREWHCRGGWKWRGDWWSDKISFTRLVSRESLILGAIESDYADASSDDCTRAGKQNHLQNSLRHATKDVVADRVLIIVISVGLIFNNSVWGNNFVWCDSISLIDFIVLVRYCLPHSICNKLLNISAAVGISSGVMFC